MGEMTPSILKLLRDHSLAYPRRDVTLETTFLVGLRSAAAALNAEMTAMLCDVTHSIFTYVSANFIAYLRMGYIRGWYGTYIYSMEVLLSKYN
jgi:hypothetical protein